MLSSLFFTEGSTMAGADRFSDFLLRVRAGDQVAAAQLVKQYQPLICRVIQKRLQQSGLSRICYSMDISQSVLGNFFARISHGGFELQSPADVGKLLVTMAQNMLRDHQRHFKGERYRINGDNTKCLQNALTLGPDGSLPGQTLVNRELAQRIRDAMSDEEWRLATAWASGRSWTEIAAEWGTKPNALRMRLSRALARTRHDLGGASN
jgi:RNA polymerase sigma factor (sigma-70 family)